MADHEIIERIRAGETSEFWKLYTKYLRPLEQWLIDTHLCRPADAHDIAHDALMRARKKLATFDTSKAEFSTWLYRLAHNHAFNRRRDEAKLVSLDALSEDLCDERASDAPVKMARNVYLWHAVRMLPQRQRFAVIMVVMKGHSCADAARRLGVTRRQLDYALVLGLEALRRLLAHRPWARK